MSARDKFEMGERVKLSPIGLERLGSSRGKYCPYNENMRGTVVGFSHASLCVRILRDGLKVPDTYHMDFWRKA